MVVARKVIVVGAFPPPLHGMAAVNAAVLARLKEMGKTPLAINLAAPTLDRSLFSRMMRVPRVLRGLWKLIFPSTLSGATLYMSLSGGWGQVYELAFLVVARLRGMRVFLHHHSYAYLRNPMFLARILIKTSGSSAVHVTQCTRMAERLKTLYGAKYVVPVSNAVFFLHHGVSDATPRKLLKTLGFISNITAEKGIFELLDLFDAIQDGGYPLRAMLAGPFGDIETERKVRARLVRLPSVEYVGSKYGIEKDDFFAAIDALVFPTRYRDETEGIVNLEAMSYGIPVIVYGRGCIPEIVGIDCGNVIDPSEPFVPAALAQIEIWLDDPVTYEAASRGALKRSAEIYALNERRWQALLSDLAGRRTDFVSTVKTGEL